MNPDQEPEIRPARSRAELLAALRVRHAVFVLEQGVPLAEEMDAWDDSARHFVVVSRGEIVGTGRLILPDAGAGKIGRVALLAGFRGRGWGERLIRALVAQCRALGLGEVYLDAQAGAVPFYEHLGFALEGEEFLDAGIAHRRMRRPV